MSNSPSAGKEKNESKNREERRLRKKIPLKSKSSLPKQTGLKSLENVIQLSNRAKALPRDNHQGPLQRAVFLLSAILPSGGEDAASVIGH